jgi:ribose transport system permease protein
VAIHPQFSDFDLQSLAMGALPLAFAAAAQTAVVISGGLDLSLGSVMAVANVLAASTMEKASFGESLLLAAAVLVAGAAIGALNGLIVVLSRILGTGLMTEGMLVVYSQKMMANAPRVPQFIEDLGAGKFLGGIPNDLVLWAPIAIVIIFILRRTGYGRLLYAIGDNSEACNLAGIRVWRILVVNYVTCSLLAAAAGLVIVGGTDAADLSLADVYLLPSVAAVIIGGTSIFGGRGGYSGTIIGALILTVLNSILTLLDAPEPVRQILYGSIILLLAAAYTRLTD